MSNETIIRFNFCDIRNNHGLGKWCHPRSITLHPTISVKHVFNLSVPRHSFLHHTSQVRLVRSRMGSCIFREVSIDVSTDISVPVESWSIIGQEPVESRPICWRHSAATVYRSIVGRESADTLPTDHVPSLASLSSGGFQALISTAISTSMQSLLSEMLMC